ncbi:adenylate/guanylate cyclase domain-containing protein [Nocardia sp. NPDC051570]|uniref:adenylate/guanylate cyclase domain-containing protein n=1 Tax=Nocardia sp. NPDC051570 TaxID=3364324 RepID=UPI0037BD890D
MVGASGVRPALVIDAGVIPTALGPAPWGSRLLGPAEESEVTKRIRVQLLLTGGLIAVNLIGVAMAILLIAFVLPGPTLFIDRLAPLNFVGVPVAATTAVVIGTLWGTVSGLRALRWAINPTHVPTEAEQIASAGVPRRLVLLQALLWSIGAAVLTPLYAAAEPALVPDFVLGISFSATVVCTNSYLIAEFALRVVTAKILNNAAPSRRPGIGIFGRSMLVWILGSGAPVALSMVVAVLALSGIEVSTDRLAVCMLSMGGAILGFGLLLITLNLSAIVAPIRAVRDAMRRVEDGDLDVAVSVYDGTESGELQSGFNQMVTGLREREQIRDLFGRHVGHHVADAAIGHDPQLGGRETEAATLFIDIIGSTTMIATQPAEEIVDILNEFFGIVVDEVERRGGLLNKFEGDAALAVFGTPTPLPDAAGAALESARAIQDRLAHNKSTFTAGIGVSAGRVIAGNVGADHRYEFTVIGDPVNEAARLCELAKRDPARILAAATTVASADPVEKTHWRPAEIVILRGRTQHTRLARPDRYAQPEPSVDEA